MKARYSAVSFDDVAPLNPADKTAGMVAGQGEHFEIKVNETQKHQSTPIKTAPITQDILDQPTFVDFSGSKFGRLTVIGKAAEGRARPVGAKNYGQNRNWVVRCVCGSYEIRKNKALKRFKAGENLENARCRWCDKTENLRNGHGKGMAHKIEVTPLFYKTKERE